MFNLQCSSRTGRLVFLAIKRETKTDDVCVIKESFLVLELFIRMCVGKLLSSLFLKILHIFVVKNRRVNIEVGKIGVFLFWKELR